MKQQSFSVWAVTLTVSLLLMSMFACSTEDPTSPDDNDNQANEMVQSTSSSSVAIYQNISSFKQVTTLIQGPAAIADLDVPEVKDPNTATNFARSMKQKAFTLLSRDMKALSKNGQVAFGDSVIWDVTERNEKEGVTYRVSLIYDTMTGKARLFVVGFDYREGHPLEYDSTEIRADLNFTILDDSDDVLLSLENLKRYRPGQLISEENGSFVPDAHAPGTEPTGGILMSEVKYSDSSFISSTKGTLEFHEGQGGSYMRTSKFSDGSESSEEATFNVDGTGTFSESRRDGTQIDGTFDSAEEDGKGGFSLTTTFPAGHDPVSVSESGEFDINASDSTISGSFEREVTLLNGDVEKESVMVSQVRVGDVLTTSLNVENADGSNGHITITESPEVDQVSGEWTNTDETFLVFTAQSYPDDSAHLDAKVYASEVAFEDGAEPIASAVFDFYPDGSGMGVVTEDGKIYDVTIHPDGSVTIKERE